jgi:hypothetical protein
VIEPKFGSLFFNRRPLLFCRLVAKPLQFDLDWFDLTGLVGLGRILHVVGDALNTLSINVFGRWLARVNVSVYCTQDSSVPKAQ